LLSARGVLATLAGAGFAVFLPALASFFDDALGLPPLAGFCALGALFFAVAPFFEEAFSCATVAPCSATVAVVSVVVASTFGMVLV